MTSKECGFSLLKLTRRLFGLRQIADFVLRAYALHL
jgi:hypothetical protein